MALPTRQAEARATKRYFVPAGTEPEATSPETDSPARSRAEICYLFYQASEPLGGVIFSFSTSVSRLYTTTYGASIVVMLCINQHADEM